LTECLSLSPIFFFFFRWDVSRVTSLEAIFAFNAFSEDFNDDISRWDTKRVTSMSAAFWKAHEFNQDLSKWQTSSVTSFYMVFRKAWVNHLALFHQLDRSRKPS
jgi:surface protein